MDERDRLAALMGTMRQLAEALAAGDAATLGPLLSIGYKHTDRFDNAWFRDEGLAQVRPQPKPAKAMDFGHHSALLHGNFGIATGIKHLRVAGAREDEQSGQPHSPSFGLGGTIGGRASCSRRRRSSIPAPREGSRAFLPLFVTTAV